MTREQKEQFADALNYLNDGHDLISQLSSDIVSDELARKLHDVIEEIEDAYHAQSHRESE